MPLDPMIAGGFRGIELQNPLEAYGRIAQIQNMQQQNALNALQMQKAQRELNVENQLAQLYARPDADIRSPAFLREVFAVSPVKGAAMQKSAFEAEKEDRLARAAQADFAAKRMKLARDMLPSVTSPEMYASWRENTVKDLPGLASLIPAEYSPETTRALMLEADKALEQHFVSQNLGGAQQVLAMPKYGAGAAQLVPGSRVSDVPLPPEIEAQKARIAKAGASNISVSTEKKYGEAFGSKLADVDINKMTTAEKAPQLAESANRIIGLVNQGNVFTGPASEIKLNIARALNVAGANNAEQIANTEKLIAATGQSTLDAIKGAGLGTGQGFTNKDLDFLRGIAGGTIGLTPQTLTELATLQHRVAVRSAESWGKRVREMPKEVVQGTGISMEPIAVPPLAQPKLKGAAPSSPAPAGVDAALWNVMTPQERALWKK